jgi:hypothetical protein
VGEAFLVDASAEEQACASCMVAIAVDKQGSCCGINYLKPGMLTLAEIKQCQEVRYSLPLPMYVVHGMIRGTFFFSVHCRKQPASRWVSSRTSISTRRR